MDSWNARTRCRNATLVYRHLVYERAVAKQVRAAFKDRVRKCGLILQSGTLTGANLVFAPNSTRDPNGRCRPQMKLHEFGERRRSGEKTHFGVHSYFGLVHTVRGNVVGMNEVIKSSTPMRAEKAGTFSDADYEGAQMRPNPRTGMNWYMTMHPRGL